jgi:hypothetical protein
MTTSRGTADERRRVLLARPPRGSDGVDLLETDLERALLGDPEAPGAVIAEATAAAIGAVRRRGWVELPAKHFPATGVPIRPVTWLSAYGICRKAGDRAALAALSHPPVLGLFGHEAWTAVAHALIGPTEVTVGEARAALRAPGAADLDMVAEHLLAMIEATLRGDDAIDVLSLIGAAVLAHDRGSPVTPGDWVFPPIWVRDEQPTNATPVRYRYPEARLHRPEEATWFLDLEGFPRTNRSHDGTAHIARGAPGLPEAILTATARPELPDLLDVGELVLAADLLAQRAATVEDQHAARGWLVEAADCLADARARTEPRFVSERGQHAFRADPARFTPEALSTVEGAWRQIVDDWDPDGPPLAVLRLRLEPLLHAIAFDGTGVALRDVRPRDGDYAKVFTPECRERARDRYERLWSGPIDFRHPAPGSRVEIQVSPAAGGENLVRDRVWATWRYVVPGETAVLAYDGLVWCDDHWAWFPKPHRL